MTSTDLLLLMFLAFRTPKKKRVSTVVVVPSFPPPLSWNKFTFTNVMLKEIILRLT